MLRSSRKSSPNHTASVLPTYYNGSTSSNGLHNLDINNGSTNGILSSSTPSIPFPTLQRRRRPTSPSKIRSSPTTRISYYLHYCYHNFWTVLLVITTCTIVGTYLMAHYVHDPQARHSISSLHKAIHRTILEKVPPKFRFDHHLHRAATALLPPQPPKQGFYDVAIVGTGPAGLTAALFAARAGLAVLVLGSSEGGSQLAETERLDNFPSFVVTSGSVGGSADNRKGSQWLSHTKQQAAQWGATFAQSGLLVEQLTVVPANQQSTTFTLDLVKSNPEQKQPLQVHTRSVIVATGATGRRLGLPKENVLWGKSVHSCAICDGSSYVDKVVVVVGGGDAAVDAALLLSRYAKQVILVHRRAQLRASNQRNIELLRNTPNIRVEVPYVIETLETFQAVVGRHLQTPQEMLAAVDLKDVETGDKQRIACDAVFELIGSTPNTQWLKQQGAGGPQLTADGFVVLQSSAESKTATTLDGVFAAGEVTDQLYRQAITAAAEGAQAAMDAERWLRDRPLPANLHATPPSSSPPPIPLENVLVPEDNLLNDDFLSDHSSNKRHKHDPPEQKPPPCDDLTQQDCITKLIHLYPVVVFSKPWCPYCRKALDALAQEGLPDGNPNLHTVDLSKYGADVTRQIQSTLQAMTGRRTVPNVFVGGTSIGGGDETSKFHRDGTLRSKLLAAGAVPGDDGDVEVRSGRAPCDDLTQEACITRLVNQHPVVMFSKEGCPHCRKALEALALEGVTTQDSSKLFVVNLSTMANKQQVQDQLEHMTGRRTVPNVFLGGSTIGGGSETVQLQRSGDLRRMLEKVHAI